MSLISKLNAGQVVLEIVDEAARRVEPGPKVTRNEILSGHWALDILFGLFLGIFFCPLMATAFLFLGHYLWPKLADITIITSHCAWATAAFAALLFLVCAYRRHWVLALVFALTSVPVSALFFGMIMMGSGGAD